LGYLSTLFTDGVNLVQYVSRTILMILLLFFLQVMKINPDLWLANSLKSTPKSGNMAAL